MERRMSSFATGKTVDTIRDNSSAGSDHRSPGYYNDPRNIGRGVEDAFNKYAIDMPQTIRENIDAARSGESPKGMDLWRAPAEPVT